MLSNIAHLLIAAVYTFGSPATPIDDGVVFELELTVVDVEILEGQGVNVRFRTVSATHGDSGTRDRQAMDLSGRRGTTGVFQFKNSDGVLSVVAEDLGMKRGASLAMRGDCDRLALGSGPARRGGQKLDVRIGDTREWTSVDVRFDRLNIIEGICAT